MTDKVTIGVQFDQDSELLEDFKAYKEARDFESRAETLRHMMRKELREGVEPGHEQVTREQLEEALRETQREAQYGAWETAALSSATLLASFAIAVAVLTILPTVPSFEGIATASLLLAGALGVVFAVVRGTVGRLERRFSAPRAAAVDAVEVSDS